MQTGEFTGRSTAQDDWHTASARLNESDSALSVPFRTTAFWLGSDRQNNATIEPQCFLDSKNQMFLKYETIIETLGQQILYYTVFRTYFKRNPALLRSCSLPRVKKRTQTMAGAPLAPTAHSNVTHELPSSKQHSDDPHE